MEEAINSFEKSKRENVGLWCGIKVSDRYRKLIYVAIDDVLWCNEKELPSIYLLLSLYSSSIFLIFSFSGSIWIYWPAARPRKLSVFWYTELQRKNKAYGTDAPWEMVQEEKPVLEARQKGWMSDVCIEWTRIHSALDQFWGYVVRWLLNRSEPALWYRYYM